MLVSFGAVVGWRSISFIAEKKSRCPSTGEPATALVAEKICVLLLFFATL